VHTSPAFRDTGPRPSSAFDHRPDGLLYRRLLGNLLFGTFYDADTIGAGGVPAAFGRDVFPWRWGTPLRLPEPQRRALEREGVPRYRANDLQAVTRQVVEAACESLVIGQF
jgi:hypothetical protein